MAFLGIPTPASRPIDESADSVLFAAGRHFTAAPDVDVDKLAPATEHRGAEDLGAATIDYPTS
jgi:hypothetical protein